VAMLYDFIISKTIWNHNKKNIRLIDGFVTQQYFSLVSLSALRTKHPKEE